MTQNKTTIEQVGGLKLMETQRPSPLDRFRYALAAVKGEGEIIVPATFVDALEDDFG